MYLPLDFQFVVVKKLTVIFWWTAKSSFGVSLEFSHKAQELIELYIKKTKQISFQCSQSQ